MTQPAEEWCPKCKSNSRFDRLGVHSPHDSRITYNCDHPWHSAKVAPEAQVSGETGTRCDDCLWHGCGTGCGCKCHVSGEKEKLEKWVTEHYGDVATGFAKLDMWEAWQAGMAYGRKQMKEEAARFFADGLDSPWNPDHIAEAIRSLED